MYNTQHLFEINSNGGFLDGTKIRDYLSFASTSSIYLFNLNIDSPSDYRCKSKIWKYEHKRNGVLVRDMIPVLDWNMTPCMYDRVTEQLFYNQGTGTFQYGREIHPVEYIEGTGTQYINTLYKAIPATTKFELSFTPTTVSGNTFLFGARPDTSAGAYTMTSYKANARLRQDCAGASSYFTNSLTTTGKYLFTAYNATVTLNDESYTGTVTRSTTRSDYDFLLFTVNTAGTVDNRMFLGKVYSCKLWDNGTLVRDFIPAIDENGVGFMFDRVSHTIYDNAGTGAFKYPAREVEYLESSGTQYIDTGVVGKSGLTAKLKFKYNSGTVGNDKYILACAQTSPAVRFYFGTYQSKWQYGYGSALQANGIQDETLYDCEVSWIKSNQYVKVNGITIITGTSGNEYDTQLNMYLFTRNQPGSTVGFIVGATLYYCQLFENGIMVRDFIPAYQDGVAGMWDKANNVFYQNAGTGDGFITGKIVEPEYE